MNRSVVRLAACLLLPLSTLASQEAERFLPPEPLFRIDCAGPAALAEAFGETNLGQMLTSAEFAELIQPLREAIETELGADSLLDDARFERLRELITAADGRLTFTFAGDLDLENEKFHGLFAVVLAPGESDNVAEFAAFLDGFVEEAVEDGGERLTELEIEGVRFRALSDEDEGMSVTMPQLIDGHLVMYVADSGLEDAVGELLRREAPSAAERTEAPVSVSIDLRKLIDQVKAGLADEPAPIDPEVIFGALRLDNVPKVEVTARPEGEHVWFDVVASVEGGQPSLLDLMRSRQAGPCDLIRIVPREHPVWSVTPFRFDVFWEIVGDLIDAFSDFSGMAREDVAAMAEEQLGLRLEEDLIAHLGDEFLQVSNLEIDEPDVDPDNPAFMMSGTAFFVELRDGQAFQASLEKVLRSRGLHAARKTQQYRGFDVHSMSLAGMVELSYVYGADFFGLGIAASGGDQVRQVLDVAAERREGRDPGEFPEVVSKALEAMPQGWSGLGVTNVSGMLDAMVRALSVDAEIDAEVVEKTRPVLEGVARLLRRYDLEKTVSGFAVQGDRLVNRTIW